MEQVNLILGSSEVLGSWIFAAGHTQQAQLVGGAERTPSELVCECAACYHIIVLGTSFCCLTGSWRAGTAATGAPLQDRKSSSTAAAVTTGAPIHTAQKPSNKPYSSMGNSPHTSPPAKGHGSKHTHITCCCSLSCSGARPGRPRLLDTCLCCRKICAPVLFTPLGLEHSKFVYSWYWCMFSGWVTVSFPYLPNFGTVPCVFSPFAHTPLS